VSTLAQANDAKRLPGLALVLQGSWAASSAAPLAQSRPRVAACSILLDAPDRLIATAKTIIHALKIDVQERRYCEGLNPAQILHSDTMTIAGQRLHARPAMLSGC